MSFEEWRIRHFWGKEHAAVINIWRKHALVGKSESEVRRQLGDGFVYYNDEGFVIDKFDSWPIMESDIDLVYKEKKHPVLSKDKARLIVCFKDGECIGVVEAPFAAKYHLFSD